MNKYRIPLIAAAATLLAGCVQSTMDSPALEVEIRDARTGAQAWYDAKLITVRAGAETDTVDCRRGMPADFEPRVMRQPSRANRPGTYDVTIIHPRYRTWRREGIRVGKSGTVNPLGGDPHPKTVHIVAELEPVEGS
jgi:hypothetical protein